MPTSAPLWNGFELGGVLPGAAGDIKVGPVVVLHEFPEEWADAVAPAYATVEVLTSAISLRISPS
jgi:hypothetical protein